MREFPFTKTEEFLVPSLGTRPIDYFFLLVDVIYLETVVSRTYVYALELFYGPNTTPKSRICRWKDLTVLLNLKHFWVCC